MSHFTVPLIILIPLPNSPLGPQLFFLKEID